MFSTLVCLMDSRSDSKKFSNSSAISVKRRDFVRSLTLSKYAWRIFIQKLLAHFSFYLFVFLFVFFLKKVPS